MHYFPKRGTFPGVFVHRHCQQRVNLCITVAVVAVANIPLCFHRFRDSVRRERQRSLSSGMRKQKRGSRATAKLLQTKPTVAKHNVEFSIKSLIWFFLVWWKMSSHCEILPKVWRGFLPVNQEPSLSAKNSRDTASKARRADTHTLQGWMWLLLWIMPGAKASTLSSP